MKSNESMQRNHSSPACLLQTEEESAISGFAREESSAGEEFSFINPQPPREVEPSISISDYHPPREESSISDL